MTLRDVALRLYSGMLCLYPPQFRAEYADEMRDVFKQAVGENENTLSLMGLLLAEMRDLPISVLREHWREQKDQPQVLQEVYMFDRIYSPGRFRFCTISLLGLAALYIFSATAAYFVFDLHINLLWKAQDWWYTIGQQPTYLFNRIPILYLLGILLWLVSSLWVIVAGGLLVVMLWRQWHQLVQRMRVLGATALIAAITMFVTMGSPIGYMAALWFYD